jgi:hypothetical protein
MLQQGEQSPHKWQREWAPIPPLRDDACVRMCEGNARAQCAQPIDWGRVTLVCVTHGAPALIVQWGAQGAPPRLRHRVRARQCHEQLHRTVPNSWAMYTV